MKMPAEAKAAIKAAFDNAPRPCEAIHSQAVYGSGNHACGATVYWGKCPDCGGVVYWTTPGSQALIDEWQRSRVAHNQPSQPDQAWEV